RLVLLRLATVCVYVDVGDRLLYALVRFSFFFSSRRRHTRSKRDWSSDVCSSDLLNVVLTMPKIKTLETVIKALLDAGHASGRVEKLIREYIDVIGELPFETEEGEDGATREQYNQKAADFLVRFEEMTPEPMPKLDLPKEKRIEHDGNIENFRAFWLRFDKRVISNDALSGRDDLKHRCLCDAVVQEDLNMIVGLEWEKAVEYLKTKYTSATAIRAYLVEKFSRIEMSNERDLDGLKELKQAAAIATLVASECPEE